MLVEVSFEVGNKAGGIHTVLKTKARLMQRLFRDYMLVGFYDERRSPPEFEEGTPPDWLMDVFDRVDGAEIHYGTWLVPGKPLAILIEPTGAWREVNWFKGKLWEWYGIDSLRTDADGLYNATLAWGLVVGRLLVELSRVHRISTIFHEWLSAPGMLYIRRHAPHVPTVFHTHATILGRTLANAGYDLYAMVDEGIRRGKRAPDDLAYRFFIEAKHQMERAAAETAHVFTTVSSVTATECRYILGKSVDLVLPNGLDMERVPPIEEAAVKHTENEEAINDFVRAYFAPYYDIDVERTLYFFFSGRYDIRVKGIDVLIDALSLLNASLKKEGSRKNVVFFFWVAGPRYPLNPEVLANIAEYRSIVDYVEKHVPRLRRRIIEDIARGRLPSADIFDEDFIYGLRKVIFSFRSRQGKLPPISTHLPPEDDFIYRRLREAGLVNRPDDPVKVIYYPAYLSPGDGLLSLSYMDAVTGTHLGVFPSYYEPWGYTPLETAAWGVPAITTDVAGFGQFLRSLYGDWVSRSGIMVLRRRGVDDLRFARELADAMHHVLTLPRRERLEKKIEAKYMAKNAAWENVIDRYAEAVRLAEARAKP